MFPARLMNSKTQTLCHGECWPHQECLSASRGAGHSSHCWETLSKGAAVLGTGSQRENTRFDTSVAMPKLLSVVPQSAASWYRNSCPTMWTLVSTYRLGCSVERLPAILCLQELSPPANNKRERRKCRYTGGEDCKTGRFWLLCGISQQAEELIYTLDLQGKSKTLY